MPLSISAGGKFQTSIKKATNLTTRGASVTSQDTSVARKVLQRKATRNAIAADKSGSNSFVYKATRPIVVSGTSYAVGATVPTTSWVNVESFVAARWIEES
ncbi:hypothetical protein UFOVP1264_15 [uncultured Caudovirales phage]|uniref:Uncharacterized protein n=1 Tax=uncultured Caudovirales phage TaxID=2100421 RepID=A0A6J5RAE9_9CAUD|nr:hypothetical protein UFOVP1264_15 [uncultured Caudovirales phage]